MTRLWTRVMYRIREDEGASMVEYALLIVLIAIIALLAIRLAGNQVSEAFSEVGSGLQ
ncbi:MAG TPA: Flp family type IVb pilin [Acidimicrobiia bacterium]|nr:Flp family type IVb pilin [Acidimicrobiia bacterium]